MNEKTLLVERFVRLDGDLLLVISGPAVPPGSRVVVPLDQDAGALRGKVVSLRPVDDGYEYRVRLHGLTRQQREALASLDTGSRI